MKRPKRIDTRFAMSTEMEAHISELNAYIDVLEGQVTVLKAVVKGEPTQARAGQPSHASLVEKFMHDLFGSKS